MRHRYNARNPDLDTGRYAPLANGSRNDTDEDRKPTHDDWSYIADDPSRWHSMTDSTVTFETASNAGGWRLAIRTISGLGSGLDVVRRARMTWTSRRAGPLSVATWF